MGPTGRPGSPAAASAPITEATADSGRRWWPASGTRRARSGCWAPSPAARPRAAAATGRPAQAALERLASWSRHRHHRDQPHPDRDRPGRRLDRTVGRQERDGR
jgi:hypothetical protein